MKFLGLYHLTLILWCSLLALFTLFRDMILYSRNTLTIEDIYDALFIKEKKKHLVGSEARDGESIVVNGHHGKGSLKSNFTNQVCFYCKKRWHIRRDSNKLYNKGNLATN